MVVAVLLGMVVVPSAAAGAATVTWEVKSSPNVGVADGLDAVSCSSASACAAVGSYSDGSVFQTLIEMWDGTSWSVVSSPNVGLHDNFLDGVSCVSAGACTAVGSYGNGIAAQAQTLIEVWDGTSWSVVSSPSIGVNDTLGGVSCTSVSACTAVGSNANSSGASQALIEVWDGTSWSVVSSPTSAGLDAISCVSAGACTAVGMKNAGGATATLVEVWDGTSWSVVSSPNVGNARNQLSGISCVSVSACTAVGYWANSASKGPGPFKTLVEMWDGTSWSVKSSPNPSTVDSSFAGVSCIWASTCTAVGTYNKGSGNQTLVENWNGWSWSVKSSPNVGTLGSFSFGASCTSTTSCTSVGSYFAGSDSQTLIEMSAAPTATITPASGAPGTSVMLRGAGFRPGESASFSYATRLSSPTTIVLCNATVDTYGMASCSATIPITNDGPLGRHTITAKGLTSHVTAKTIFTLT